MRALLMIMGHVLLEDMGEGVFAKEDEPRQTLLFDRAHPAFGVSIQIWRPRQQWHPCDPSCFNALLKGRTIFPVSVMDEVLPGSQEAPLFHGHIPRDLDHPALVRMWGHPSHVHLPAGEVDKKQHVIRHQPSCRPDLGGEEVGGDQHIHMRTDKLFPRSRLLALGGWEDAVALQNVAHRLVTNSVAQMLQGTDDPIVTPGAILLCHVDNQGFQLSVNSGTAWRLPLWRTIKLLSNQFAMPGEDSVRCDNLRYFRQGLLPQLLTDCGKRLAFAICQPHTPRDLVAQDAIFRDEIFIAQQQFLIDSPGDIR